MGCMWVVFLHIIATLLAIESFFMPYICDTMHIRIGTRSSRLAIWQAEYIQTLLKNGDVSSELVFIETKGDLVLDRSLVENW